MVSSSEAQVRNLTATVQTLKVIPSAPQQLFKQLTKKKKTQRWLNTFIIRADTSLARSKHTKLLVLQEFQTETSNYT